MNAKIIERKGKPVGFVFKLGDASSVGPILDKLERAGAVKAKEGK